MQRYFIPNEGWNGDVVTITKEDAHHIVNVMRMQPEDEIICCHTDGRVARCKIENITSEQVLCSVVEWLNENKELPVQITIAQALPKGDKLDYIVQKGTELGATAFIPYHGERSIVKWNDQKAKKKGQRLEKIAKEASEQSHRTKIPFIHSVQSLETIMHSSEYQVKLVASEEEAKTSNPSLLSDAIGQIRKGDHILLVIGPEGGFSSNELVSLKEANFSFVRLGPRILRTETASLYFLSILSYQFEELG
ncbi:16S rRNA (uracil(1498)-N(3))-methyltransferase [Salirhabdus salicampi]|uniref:16S rRNA (uracil(1498)-N(3))-methyltransferase n=1 Tax=Salirhabdus salicampi TaxID=476102 RepID=UPI0020C1D893|nr:16S rRNA (uracil(1498)-N(3))-methyltransferase [Salirhabdus salicampi]MCP8616911.1 16S rRNA (uracil(1498)-N(3))-methyltransferase [Salirhabdus salicampi]